MAMENSSAVPCVQTITDYLENNHHVNYERALLNELLDAIQKKDSNQMEWFMQFGDRLRVIVFNVNAYRKGLKFGFTEIDFDEYGWLKRPSFLEKEELKFGLTDKDRYGNYSTITLGRGPNNSWAYGMSVSYGTAGSSSGLSVYDPIFKSREDALDNAIKNLKDMMIAKVGDKDTTNYNQKIILATLKGIDAMQVAKVQLTLF